MQVDPFLMLESDLLAVTSAAVLAGCFRLAMPVRIAASVRRSECEVLLAGYAAAPHKGQDEKQRKKRTGQRPQHSLPVYRVGKASEPFFASGSIRAYREWAPQRQVLHDPLA